LLPDPVLRPPGWSHQEVSANGARFHAVVEGTGPAVLLLHGFPMFWWTWRDQIRELSQSGFTAIAMDLRGTGGSDKPPRGYDPLTMAQDAAGVLRSLGHNSATVVGTGFGGLLAWTLAAVNPDLINRVGIISSLHPHDLRRALRSPAYLRTHKHLLRYQIPMAPERSLVSADAAEVSRILNDWSGPGGWSDDAAADHFRQAMLQSPTAFCWMETFRWLIRSLPRSDGRRWMRRTATPIRQPALLIDGAEDPLATAGHPQQQWLAGPVRRLRLDGVGHFAQEEAAEHVSRELLQFLGDR
jgi:pimeloyl-ACP methyl ester carboxylesterase